MIAWLQGLPAWLDLPMQAVSRLGQGEFYLVLLLAVYWCIDAGLGLRLAIVLLGGVALNNALKVAAHGPRPLWLDPQLHILSAATDFGMPSGHTQHATSVWGLLASSLPRRGVWPAAVAWMVLMGVSRLYLAAHFPTDVLAGWAAGAAWLWVFWRLAGPVGAWMGARPRGLQVGLCFIGSVAALLVVVVGLVGLEGWSLPPAWVANSVASLGMEPEPFQLHEAAQAAGTLFGITAGAVVVSGVGGFLTAGSTGQRSLRLVLGTAVALGLWYGLSPTNIPLAAPGGYAMDYVRSALTGAWISAGAPLLFRRVGLAAAASARA